MRIFFFSSRRRHTRSLCDWSSDVCSSDLGRLLAARPARRAGGQRRGDDGQYREQGGGSGRSEERRVGKECRSRRSAQHEKKKDVDNNRLLSKTLGQWIVPETQVYRTEQGH